MLLDLNQKFVSLEGKIIQDVHKNQEGEDIREDLTLYRIIALALIEPVGKIADDDKIKYYELFVKIVNNKGNSVDLSVEELVFVKSVIKTKFGVLLVGQALRMLEGKEVGIILNQEQPSDVS